MPWAVGGNEGKEVNKHDTTPKIKMPGRKADFFSRIFIYTFWQKVNFFKPIFFICFCTKKSDFKFYSIHHTSRTNCLYGEQNYMHAFERRDIIILYSSNNVYHISFCIPNVFVQRMFKVWIFVRHPRNNSLYIFSLWHSMLTWLLK